MKKQCATNIVRSVAGRPSANRKPFTCNIEIMPLPNETDQTLETSASRFYTSAKLKVSLLGQEDSKIVRLRLLDRSSRVAVRGDVA